MSNVILFPGTKRDSPPQTLEEIYENITLLRESIVDEKFFDIVNKTFEAMAAAGFPIEQTEQNTKEISLMAESIRALIYKYLEIDHPLHKVADSIFIHLNKEEPDSEEESLH